MSVQAIGEAIRREAAEITGRPVRWISERSEGLPNIGGRRFRLGVTPRGALSRQCPVDADGVKR